MRFPEKTLTDLEWSKLKQHLAGRCTGEEAAERCLSLPLLDGEAAWERLFMVQEFMRSIEGGDPPPSLPARPVGEALRRIRGDAPVTAEALIDIARNLRLYTAIARYLENRRDACPKNAAAILRTDGTLSILSVARLAGEIGSCFEPDGTMADGASPELAKLRRRIHSLRQHLIARIEKIAEQEADLLQERTVTLRGDRFVLPVRADAHRRFAGIVHGASGSGATIFVEPDAVIETGNDLMLAREESLREEARVLAGLSRAVKDQIGEVEAACGLVVEVEMRIASARLAIDLGAHVPEPAEPGHLDLRGARHPLLALDGVAVVPNDIRAAPGRAIVISGPNAGGKTVVLKTVGLLGLMAAAGLPIPADPDSSLGVPGQILTDIGDDQSLSRNLSTFSAHMTNIAAILEAAERGAIVLLDELAAGTDPAEGAALAEAICEALNGKLAATFATTHFDALKLRGQAGGGFENAAVTFDMARMRPTFRFLRGAPGSSSALVVAGRFGVPGTVVERARTLLGAGARDLQGALEALDAERSRLAIERQAHADARHRAEEAKQRSQEQIAELKARSDRLIDEETKALWSAIRAARQKVHEVEKSIKRRDVRIVDANQARKEINQIAEGLEPGGKLSAAAGDGLPGKPAKAEELSGGAKVYVIPFAAAGTVDGEVRGGQIFVRVGAIRTRVKIEDIRILAEGDRGEAARAGKRPERKPGGKAREAPAASTGGDASEIADDAIKTRENTLDLRGMTADEAIDAADLFLDQSFRQDLDVVFILHGHGTGALKKAIRAHLEQSEYVDRFRPGKREEGGDGITVALLR